MSNEDIERHLRGRTGKYILKPNTCGKDDEWKHFSIVYEKRVDADDIIRRTHAHVINATNVINLKMLVAG